MRIEGGGNTKPVQNASSHPALAQGHTAAEHATKAEETARAALDATKKARTPEDASAAAKAAADAAKQAHAALDQAKAALEEAKKAPPESVGAEPLAQLQAHVKTAQVAATRATSHAEAAGKAAQAKTQGSSFSDKANPHPLVEAARPEQHIARSLSLGRTRAASGAGASFATKGREITLTFEGKVTTEKVTPDNAKELLGKLKKADPTGTAPGTYAARQAILEHSGGKVESHEAFTLKELPTKDLSSFMIDRSNWIPERLALQDEIVGKEVGHAEKLSARIAEHGETGVVYALRGNTASGKSTTVKKDPELSKKVLDSDGETRGAMNPDPIKAQLVAAHAGKISTQQSHWEGSAMSQRVERAMLAKPDSSLVLDKRFAGANDIPQLLKAIGTRKLKLIDLEVPLETSCVRVLTRKPGTADPLVPFAPVGGGFSGVRQYRQDLLLGREDGPEEGRFQGVIENKQITDYKLYVTDAQGQQTLVAEKRDGKWLGPDTAKKQALFDQAVGADPSQDIAQVKATVIDTAFIKKQVDGIKAQGFPGADAVAEKTRVSLEAYQGKTLDQALDAHSKQ
ncbi:hypothetical protein DRW03_15125 [Corallococcus sp. H22C18031201]|uniref:XopAJ/AvrRxo1 family type III secretion system effector zeta toxin n=1 Tax=Citreicoccus inhibens TaxID=2849499 RepID=UPI000E761D44|nr:XopAJ/AvrRxo1 family type III secretion system effector zeta toxin [Citreicoccus inhibens]MBU8895324.1 hypothetical protein [Citreicoccus inhibens]RJS22631.1 hypothetical protein DRW03_15125 [Corallococcus sp. H22C18031201]